MPRQPPAYGEEGEGDAHEQEHAHRRRSVLVGGYRVIWT